MTVRTRWANPATRWRSWLSRVSSRRWAALEFGGEPLDLVVKRITDPRVNFRGGVEAEEPRPPFHDLEGAVDRGQPWTPVLDGLTVVVADDAPVLAGDVPGGHDPERGAPQQVQPVQFKIDDFLGGFPHGVFEGPPEPLVRGLLADPEAFPDLLVGQTAAAQLRDLRVAPRGLKGPLEAGVLASHGRGLPESMGVGVKVTSHPVCVIDDGV